MLILTRRIGETTCVGDEVTVTVLGVKGNQVRLGFTAPKHIEVHREEIYERIKKEQASLGHTSDAITQDYVEKHESIDGQSTDNSQEADDATTQESE